MKRFCILLIFILLPVLSFAQEPELLCGSVERIFEEKNIDFELVFDDGVFSGYDFENFKWQYLDDNWDKDALSLEKKVSAQINESNLGFMVKPKSVVKESDEINISLKFQYISEHEKGSTVGWFIFIDKANTDTLAVIVARASGGRFGSRVNLMGDGLTNISSEFASFLNKQKKKYEKGECDVGHLSLDAANKTKTLRGVQCCKYINAGPAMAETLLPKSLSESKDMLSSNEIKWDKDYLGAIKGAHNYLSTGFTSRGKKTAREIVGNLKQVIEKQSAK